MTRKSKFINLIIETLRFECLISRIMKDNIEKLFLLLNLKDSNKSLNNKILSKIMSASTLYI